MDYQRKYLPAEQSENMGRLKPDLVCVCLQRSKLWRYVDNTVYSSDRRHFTDVIFTYKLFVLCVFSVVD